MPFISNCSRFDITQGWHDDIGYNSVLIQIISSYENFPVPLYSFPTVHQFIFEDTEDENDSESISDLQAKDIACILQDAFRDGKNILVHCHAGIYRSGAVVQAGIELGFDPPDRFRNPNKLVLRKLRTYLNLKRSKYARL